jgi:Predicted AAA-ATPase
LQKLPVDISTFSELRTANYLYVDKTQHAYNLITGGKALFFVTPTPLW